MLALRFGHFLDVVLSHLVVGVDIYLELLIDNLAGDDTMHSDAHKSHSEVVHKIYLEVVLPIGEDGTHGSHLMVPVVRVDKLVGVGNTSQMMMKEMLFYVPGDQTLMLGVGIGNDSC